jgi:hypothetical protein
MESKICSKCKIEKELCEFNKYYLSKDGHKPSCRECQKIETKIYKSKNKEKIKEQSKEYYINNKEIIIKKHNEYYLKNLEKEKNRSKKYYNNNKTKYLINQQLYRDNNREKVNKNKNNYQTNRRKNDCLYKLTENMRGRVKDYLKIKNITKNNKTFEIIGCSPEYLKEYLEQKFTEGMSWDNYGLFGWHIDHITPLSSINTEEDLYKLCHYTNLQPLWAKDNMTKGNKILKPLTNNTF